MPQRSCWRITAIAEPGGIQASSQFARRQLHRLIAPARLAVLLQPLLRILFCADLFPSACTARCALFPVFPNSHGHVGLNALATTCDPIPHRPQLYGITSDGTSRPAHWIAQRPARKLPELDARQPLHIVNFDNFNDDAHDMRSVRFDYEIWHKVGRQVKRIRTQNFVSVCCATTYKEPDGFGWVPLGSAKKPGSQWHPEEMTGCHLGNGKTRRYKNRDANSFILPSTFQSLKSTLGDGLETLPINRASEHGNAKVGGGYGALGWELLALMRSSGQGVNPSWPSLCVVPEAVICAAPDAPFGRPFVILAGTRSAPM